MKTNRRDFLKMSSAGAITVLGGFCLGFGGNTDPTTIKTVKASLKYGKRASGSNQPNIIFILIDDQRWDHLSCMGHPFLKTPNMDRLAREGVHFTNAFCTTSLCSPSRASYLTGKYVHNHGVKDNLTPWDNNKNQIFFENLKKAGYRNGFIGKWHMPGKIPKLSSVDRFITFEVGGGQGWYFNCPLIIDGKTTERPGTYVTEDLTNYALDFIRENSDGPFCLYLSHKAVHSPWRPPKELDSLYDNADLSFLPHEYYSFINMQGGKHNEGGAPYTTEHNYRKYCETLVALDRQVGRVLAELDRKGIADNTIVILASDNGYSWGEKMDVGKRDATEENLRIPFIVRYPRGISEPGRRSDAMVLNIDLAPTILDAAGAAPLRNCDGLSIMPLLGNSKKSIRTSFLYEYFKDFPYNVPEQYAVRTDKYLYVVYKGRRKPALFNIQNDSRTLHNIINTDEGKKVLPEMQLLLRNYLGGSYNG
jgi:arylsulfatase A-like enzyme